MTNPEKHRRIRSFVRREGRMTPAQKRAIEDLLPVYGLDTGKGENDFDKSFGRHAPRYLEIGFGMGASLLEMARINPDIDYIGIEVHRPGVGSLLLKLEQEAIENVRVINDDAVEVLKKDIPDQSLDAVFLFFPDPWHKKKHHKRRILQPDFVSMVASKLKTGGYFHMATDWEEYAEQMMEVMGQSTEFINAAGVNHYSKQGQRPETKYERRGQRLGHGVWDLVFNKK
jgi:tRNA (guanine-N7-)-methyltransferase